jgi:hypothetical protein
MKTILRRVRWLEDRFALLVDEERRSLAEVVRERRRRRLGAEYVERAIADEPRGRTRAQILRSHFRKHRSAAEASKPGGRR